MWFIVVNNNWYYYTENGRSYLTVNSMYAEAFGPLDIERHRQWLENKTIPGTLIELVECSSRKLLTPAMLKTLNLEHV